MYWESRIINKENSQNIKIWNIKNKNSMLCKWKACAVFYRECAKVTNMSLQDSQIKKKKMCFHEMYWVRIIRLATMFNLLLHKRLTDFVWAHMLDSHRSLCNQCSFFFLVSWLGSCQPAPHLLYLNAKSPQCKQLHLWVMARFKLRASTVLPPGRSMKERNRSFVAIYLVRLLSKRLLSCINSHWLTYSKCLRV